MAIYSSGVRDTASVININKNTLIRTLKKTGQYCPCESSVSGFKHTEPIGSQGRAGLRCSRVGHDIHADHRIDPLPINL